MVHSEKRTLPDDFRLEAFQARMKSMKAHHIAGASKELILHKAFKRINAAASGGYTELWGWVGSKVFPYIVGGLEEAGFSVRCTEVGPAGGIGPRGTWLHIQWGGHIHEIEEP